MIMSPRIAISFLALTLLAPIAEAQTRGASTVVRDHRTPPVVRDHRATPVIRDHRTTVRDHRTGASGGGVTVSKTAGAKRRPACVNNVCRDVTR